jgi:hypothetical protein
MGEEAACSGARACHSISAIVIDIVHALLLERAVDGKVDIGDVDRLLGLVRRGTVSLDSAYRLQEDKCRKEHSRPKGNVGARSNPFQRLIVRPFEHLLSGEHPVLARPVLANYFDFIAHALDHEREGLERDCRAIIQALLVVHGNNLTWDHFYSDPRTLKCLHVALKTVIRVLASAEGQRQWHHLMSRPVGDHAATLAQLAQISDALLETHRGLSAA